MSTLFNKLVCFILIISVLIYMVYMIDIKTQNYSMDEDLPYRLSNDIDGYVTIDKIPNDLKKAVICMEDKYFYSHLGFNPLSMIRALLVNIKEGRIKQGGSTLTQQLAKNLFLSNERSLKRKVKELILGVKLEIKYTKDEILEMYLNIAYFGSGAYGVQKASKVYFNKDVENLSIDECAMLAGIIQSPSRYNPKANLELARKRQKLVLKVMKEEL